MRIVVTGGGTGGHIYPALAILEVFLDETRTNGLFIGSRQRIEKNIVPKENVLFYGNDIIAFSKKDFLIFTFKFIKSYFSSLKKLKEFVPDVVFGTGGYISVPVLMAAKYLKIKTIILENDATMGSANKFLSKHVDEVVTGFDLGRFNYTGNPRGSLIYLESLKQFFEIKYDLCIFMGSLGSLSIANFLIENMDVLKNTNYRINIITGENHFHLFENMGNENVHIKAYSHNMIEDYLSSNIIICRSGAVSVSEVMALNKPCIFIPSPYVKNDEQKSNAMKILEKNACLMILEKDLTIDLLLNNVDLVYNNIVDFKKNALEFQKVDALVEITNIIIKLVGEKNVD